MADRPILFSASMVLALLAGRKTQTRRIINPQPVVRENGSWSWEGRNGGFVGAAGTHVDEGFPEAALAWMRIQRGDLLWVRENVQAVVDAEEYDAIRYMADGHVERSRAATSEEAERYACQLYDYRGRKGAPDRKTGVPVPSIHMPRWASRLTLTVTHVRVQRLQEISADDAVAEGVTTTEFWRPKDVEGKPFEDKWWDDLTFWQNYPQIAFRALWESINGTESWAANPWVAAYTLTVDRRNIDAIAAEAA